ncbi:MAG: hypothetical protein JJU36_08465 [Phycisphaeraceae bacterium]|nr:hypothetical protein [Phycisphaeraceae bacterium]
MPDESVPLQSEAEANSAHAGASDRKDIQNNRPQNELRSVRDHLEGFPRGLVFGWCCFLLLGWLVQMALWDTATASRWMLILGMIGMLVFWPAIRLATWASAWPADDPRTRSAAVWRLLLDWLFLHVVFQIVIWPLSLIGGWSVGRLLAMIGLLAGWSLWTARLMLWGMVHRSAWPRNLAMAGCLALVLAPSVAMLIWTLIAGPRNAGESAVWLWLTDLDLPRLLWTLSTPIEDVLEPWRITTMVNWPAWLVLPGAILAWAVPLISLITGRAARHRRRTPEGR